MSKITGTHHIAIRAADFPRSLSFYTGVFGLRLAAEWTTKNGRAAMIEIATGCYIEIFERPPAIFSGDAPILHFALRTDDVDGMTERARVAGYKVTVEPVAVDLETTIGKVALRLSFVEGPDGESVELMTSDKF